MRVLHVINDLRVGGAERLLTDLLPRLRSAGINAELAILSKNPSFLQEALQNGTTDKAPVPLHVPKQSVGIRSLRQVARLRGLLRGADIAHVQLFPAQLWVALAAATLPPHERPLLVTTEQNTTNRRRGNPFFRVLDNGMYGSYARIIAITDATAEALANWVPSTRSRMVVIPNAIDGERFANAPPAPHTLFPGTEANTPLLACVGRFEEQKDQPTLLRALARLPGVHAVFIGDGPLRPAAEALAQSLGITDRAHFLGVRQDVPEILKACTIYVQPSRWEGFGIAVVEAMAAGLPVVVSDVPGMREVVGEAGLRFPVGDDTALANCLHSLLADAAKRQTLREAGRQRALEFGVEACVAAHIALYRSLRANRL